MKYYSPSTEGFYDPEINTVIPEDAVEITDDHWSSLLGNPIVFVDGMPQVREPSPEEVELLRSTEYKYLRAAEYPHVTDFADAYYWMQKGVTQPMDDYLAKCEAVKLKYPKPTV